MKADPRPYPTWWLDRARERRAMLDEAVRRLRVAVVREADIVGALIFGSYAENRVGPDSDLDLIVVTTQAAGDDPGGRHADIARRLALGVPCDLIVVGHDEFERSVRRDGIWIDATPSA